MSRRTADRTYRRKRAALLNSPDLTCWLCGTPIDTTLKFPHPMSPTADHITPISHGGSNTGPLAPAHYSCNSRRGNRHPTPPTQHNRTW